MFDPGAYASGPADFQLGRASAREQVEDEHDYGEDEENVNPAPKRVAADHSDKPEYE